MIRLSGNKHATFVSAYPPTMGNVDEVKFYDDLKVVISASPIASSSPLLRIHVPNTK